MPFYEYQCSSCGHHLETMQKITEAPLRKCPECGRSTLKKLLSAPVFRLKGSGWYETDFKTDKEHKRNLADARKDEEKTEAPKAEAKEEPKSEARPDAKPEGKPEAKAEGKAEAKPASGAKSTSKVRARARAKRAAQPLRKRRR